MKGSEIVRFHVVSVLAPQDVSALLSSNPISPIADHLGDFIGAYPVGAQLARAAFLSILEDPFENPLSYFKGAQSDIFVVVVSQPELIFQHPSSCLVSKLVQGLKVVRQLRIIRDRIDQLQSASLDSEFRWDDCLRTIS